MRTDAFLDTSVLLYVIADQDPRAKIAEELLVEGGVISVQVLNEFASVAKRKYAMTWQEIASALEDIRLLCNPVLPIKVLIHETGIRIAERYGYRIYDSMHLAAAIHSGCSILYSEDMQNGQKIGGVTIRNPFANA